MRATHGGARDPRLLDFSASLHPHGPPEAVREVLARAHTYVQRYPSPDAEELCSALALHHGVSESSVLAGNGSADLIYLIAGTLAGRRVHLFRPCFAEYESACLALGARLTDHAHDADASFAANPMNPSGALVAREELLRLPGLRIVDEAFMGFTDQAQSLVARASTDPDLIVLRSLTKLYALPGLRLGYVVAHPERVAELRRRRAPWNVNGIALAAGLAALADPEHARTAPAVIAALRTPLVAALTELDIPPAPSHANYLLCRVPSATKLCLGLLERGIAARDCSSFGGLEPDRYVRFAVRTHDENARLIAALKEILS